MDVCVALLIIVHVVSGLMYTVNGQTTPPLTYVTGPNVCVINITFQETRQVTRAYRIKYYTRCKWNRRCAKYRIQLRAQNIVSDAWKFEPRCCDGFVRSRDTCMEVLADKIQTLDTGTDVTDYSIWPPIIGTLMAIFAISTIAIIIVLKRKSSSATRNGSSPVEIRAIANHIYADAMPSVSHSYETLDASQATKSHSYETLDTSRVGLTQNIYDSIDTYKILQSGSKK
ncbi:uncharacterized protein LOC110446847 [Mizuhopecten yessoensis]|uniref:EMI domain-containing protein n=1 Tax=Mizuhopecten yessoensis TaxID=6573 RepID=A0A210QWI9_MIZYE|nr:uncharacterized protein LOC110446847 [Mizuhopecten yessoensis]OWF53094.1 hypothetical protein KP79_PYT00517 [Mizuhopecten yessoensis]